MTDAPTWHAHVAAMVTKCQAHQDEEFYRLALPGWRAELARIGGDDLADETANTKGVIDIQGDHRL